MNYSYQDGIVKKINGALNKKRWVVLAACPGAGKTNMAIRVIERYVKDYPKAKILVLSHAQSILRNQWADFIRSADTGISHAPLIGGKEADSLWDEHQISITLPQTIAAAQKEKGVGLLVVDEAHQYYMANKTSKIISGLKARHRLLLTGTPSHYLNKKDYHLTGITIEELLKHGTVVDPQIEIVESAYDYVYGDVKGGEVPYKKLTKQRTIETMDKILPQLLTRLSDRGWSRKKAGWKEVCKNLGKTMIACHSVAQAEAVHTYLRSKGVGAILSVASTNAASTAQVYQGVHETDSEAKRAVDAFEEFKNSKNCNVLVVVRRGVLGFNYKDLINVIDFTGSFNVNRIFQLLCRVIRPGKTKERKLFIKATTPETAYLTFFVMSFVVALSLKKYYYTYETEYLTKKAVPVPKAFKDALDGIVLKRGGVKQLPPLPSLCTFTELCSEGEIRPIASTTFEEVIKKTVTGVEDWSPEKISEMIKCCSTRAEFHKKHPTASGYIFRKKMGRLLDAAYGEKPRWTLEKILSLPKIHSITELKRKYPGAYNWSKKTNSLDEVRSFFGLRAQPQKGSKREVYFAVNAKITNEQAQAIKKEKAAGATLKELSEKYKIGKSTVSYLINGRTWSGDRVTVRNKPAMRTLKKGPRSIIPIHKSGRCPECNRKKWNESANQRRCQFCGCLV